MDSNGTKSPLIAAGDLLHQHALLCYGRVRRVLASAAESLELTLLRRAVSSYASASRSACLSFAAAAAAACWERLHQEPWRSVPTVWRDAYAASGLLQAAALLLLLPAADGGAGAVLKAVRAVDLVLMMHGDLKAAGGLPALTCLAQRIHDAAHSAPARRMSRKRPRPTEAAAGPSQLVLRSALSSMPPLSARG